MIDLNIKNIDIVSNLGQTEQSVSNLLNPNYRPDSSITVDGLAKICDAMGCELKLEIVPKGTEWQWIIREKLERDGLNDGEW